MHSDYEDRETLRAAFALIDECTASAIDDPFVELVYECEREELAYLETEAVALQKQLQELQRRRAPQLVLADAWFHTAVAQQEECTRAQRDRQHLQDAIDKQTTLARQCRRVADRSIQQIMVGYESLFPVTAIARPLPPNTMNASYLRGRMESMYCKLAAEKPSQAVALSAFQVHRNETVEHTAAGGVRMNTVSTRMYPFKLSIVIAELWRLIAEQLRLAQQSLPHNTATSNADIHGGLWVRHTQRIGYTEEAGDFLLRRVDEADGSVVILVVSAAVSCGPESDDNLSFGFVSTEESWIRFRRVDDMGLRSKVVVESSSSLDIHPIRDAAVSRVSRLCEFMRMSVDETAARTRQLIENRLLDASRRQH